MKALWRAGGAVLPTPHSFSDGGLLSELEIGLPWHVPTSAFLFLRALFTLLVGMKSGTVERDRGLSWPLSDKFKYEHSVYHHPIAGFSWFFKD